MVKQTLLYLLLKACYKPLASSAVVARHIALATGKRRVTLLPLVLLVLVLGLVYSAEWINRLGARHWQAFAGQNYFDTSGVFLGVMFCAPLLGAGFFILIFALRSACKLLVEVKQMELKDKARRQKKAEKAE